MCWMHQATKISKKPCTVLTLVMEKVVNTSTVFALHDEQAKKS